MDKIFNCQNEFIDEENGNRILCDAIFLISNIESDITYYCPKCRNPINVNFEGQISNVLNDSSKK